MRLYWVFVLLDAVILGVCVTRCGYAGCLCYYMRLYWMFVLLDAVILGVCVTRCGYTGCLCY